MKLLYAGPSPYSAKVRLAARCVGIALDEATVATADEPAALVAANPLGKIPTLVLDDGTGLYDSRSIMRELDRRAPGTLYPSDREAARATDRREALGDGLCDAMLAIVYDRRMRPEEKQHAPYQDAQWRKVARALDALEAEPPDPDARDAGTIALAAALAYADLRHAERDWRRGRPRLAAFLETFAGGVPDWQALRPH